MTFMSENMILDNVSEYVNNNSKYAILIDGEWGCGKTFFVKKKLIPEIENNNTNRKTIYISLYGLKSCDDIMKKIFIKMIPLADNSIKNKLEPFASVILSGISLYNIKLPKINIPKIKYENFINLDKYIIFFDDLERCSIELNEILGYMNNLVEHNNVKMIIIANEKELGKVNKFNNLEAKYSLALNKNIQFPNFNISYDDIINSMSPESNDKVVKKAIDVDTLLKRCEYLFDKDILYHQIKEKLIGETMKFTPDISEILNAIIVNNVKHDKVKELLYPLKESIQTRLNTNNHNNFRTVLFTLEKFERLYSVINKIEIEDNIKLQILEDIFICCLNFSIKFRKGDISISWNQDEEFAEIALNKYNPDTNIIGFKFVYEFIFNAYFNEKIIKEAVIQYSEFLIAKGKISDDSINIIENDWWKIDDSMAIQCIEKINEKLIDNGYSYSLYPLIISRYLSFNNMGMEIDIKNIMVIMKNNITKLSDNANFEPYLFGYYVADEIKSEFNSLMADLQDYSNSNSNNNRLNKINTLLNTNDTWAQELYKYITKNAFAIREQNKFLSGFNIDILFEILIKTSNGNIIHFTNSLKFIYDRGQINFYYKDDEENIRLLKNKLNGYMDLENNNEKIKRYNLDNLVKDLEKYLSQLAQE
ncbi:P-loop NTPase fold protein [Clostridium sp. YIM B02506]|uniref:P-loop NTPase fold protein n=1 Tax=Clostridium sp. YIM B02506 TaxID=2910680 RepID=UPI001EED9171|nr:P-loop NTPase fold protein [Clostridium sp. YIM B02506]